MDRDDEAHGSACDEFDDVDPFKVTPAVDDDGDTRTMRERLIDCALEWSMVDVLIRARMKAWGWTFDAARRLTLAEIEARVADKHEKAFQSLDLRSAVRH